MNRNIFKGRTMTKNNNYNNTNKKVESISYSMFVRSVHEARKKRNTVYPENDIIWIKLVYIYKYMYESCIKRNKYLIWYSLLSVIGRFIMLRILLLFAYAYPIYLLDVQSKRWLNHITIKLIFKYTMLPYILCCVAIYISKTMPLKHNPTSVYFISRNTISLFMHSNRFPFYLIRSY